MDSSGGRWRRWRWWWLPAETRKEERRERQLSSCAGQMRVRAKQAGLSSLSLSLSPLQGTADSPLPLSTIYYVVRNISTPQSKLIKF